jgi:Protein of unknown function (DUF3037)
MSELLEGRYFVVRYMLGELRDEAVNIGLIGVDQTHADVFPRFLDDLRLKARADVPFDARAVSIFRETLDRLVDEAKSVSTIHDESWLESFSALLLENSGNLIRVRGPYSVLTGDMKTETEHLFGEWVAPKRLPRRTEEPAVRDPLGGLRREASKAVIKTIRTGLRKEFRKQSFRRAYAVRGKRHETVFDVALITRIQRRPIEHLFHHVLMLADAEESFNQAAALLWKWNDVRERNTKERNLTAVLFSREGSKREGVEEATSVLKKDKVRVAEVGQLDVLARGIDPQMHLPRT